MHAETSYATVQGAYELRTHLEAINQISARLKLNNFIDLKRYKKINIY